MVSGFWRAAGVKSVFARCSAEDSPAHRGEDERNLDDGTDTGAGSRPCFRESGPGAGKPAEVGLYRQRRTGALGRVSGERFQPLPDADRSVGTGLPVQLSE